MEKEVILLIDNYDSFTYNLYHYLGELGTTVEVFRNNKISLDDIEGMRPEKIVISPGPCTPKEAGISCDVILRFAEKIPILGVCLGHQCIGAAFGGEDHSGAVDHARQTLGGESRFTDNLPVNQKSLPCHALSFSGDRSRASTG